MGCIATKDSPEARKNAELTQRMREEAKQMQREFKLLLLGAGDSGKSTIAKQMKILHLDGFSEAELLAYKPVLCSNSIQSIKCLVVACEKFEYQLLPANKETSEEYASINPIKIQEITPQIGKEIKSLWEDPSIQKTYERSNEFQLPGVAE